MMAFKHSVLSAGHSTSAGTLRKLHEQAGKAECILACNRWRQPQWSQCLPGKFQQAQHVPDSNLCTFIHLSDLGLHFTREDTCSFPMAFTDTVAVGAQLGPQVATLSSSYSFWAHLERWKSPTFPD